VLGVRCLVLGLVMMAACAGCEAAAWHASMLPDTIAGWRAGAAKVVTKSNIFDYMDGAGELYLAYDFRDLAAREYTRASQPKITAEVYRLGNAADAYGVYSHERGASGPTGIGQDRDYGSGLLRFWKNTCFVRVVAERETAESRAAVLALGRHISSSISGTGKRPTVLSLLPKPGLIPDSVHYFHKHTVLNYHYYLSDGNILDLSDKTDALLAQYCHPEPNRRPEPDCHPELDSGSRMLKQVQHDKVAKPRLLIIRYPSAKAATDAYAHFNRAYFKDKPAPTGASRIEKVEQGHYTGVARADRVLKLVFEARTREECARLLR
jgi:hypothetical protein